MLKSLNMPKFLSLLFFVEMWERFSYYGMRALLVVFLVSKLGFTDPQAYAVYSLFAALGYVGPLLGGLFADRLMGFRKMVFVGAITIVCGHATMALMHVHDFCLYLGLSLIAVGTAFFKGNITNLLGCGYSAKDPERDRAFTLFYVSVNLGSVIAGLLCGWVAKAYGEQYGFGLAGIGMTLGLFLFVRHQDVLGTHGLPPKSKQPLFKVPLNPTFWVFCLGLILALAASFMLQHAETFSKLLTYFGVVILAVLATVTMKVQKHERIHLIILFTLMFFLMAFFAVEMQLGSLFNLFALRNVDNSIFGIEIPSTWSQSINPFSIMVFGPFLSGFFVRKGPKWSMIRFSGALLLMVLCFVMLYLGCYQVNEKAQVPYFYLFVGISLMGIGELFIAPLLQSMCTILAPERIRGFMMGVLMMSMAYANLFGVVISKFMSVPSDAGSQTDPFVSLHIYQDGFFTLGVINLVLLILFYAIYPWVNKAVQKALR